MSGRKKRARRKNYFDTARAVSLLATLNPDFAFEVAVVGRAAYIRQLHRNWLHRTYQ
jgi:hypothetical protein